MDTQHVTVTVDEEHLSSIGDVTTELRSRGLQVEQVMAAIGVVTGRSTDPAALRGVAGVASVDAEVSVQIPSPGHEVQ